MSLFDKINLPPTTSTTSSNGSTGNGTNNSNGFSVTGSSGLIGQGYAQSSGNYAINNQSWGLGNDGWSFNLWFNPQSASGNDYYLQFTETSGWRNVFYMYNAVSENGGGFQPKFIDDIGTNMGLTSVALTIGSWNMITVTWTPTDDKYRVYKNGVLLYTETYTATNAGNFGTPNRNWYLGNYASQTGTPYASRANGMDEWSWWTAPLTQADITELYNGGTGIKAKDLTSSNKIKLKVYYDFEDTVNGTLTNQAPTTVISVANQRVVENFSGSILDTDRWASQVVTTGTVTMSDSLNGGINLATGTTSGGRAKIHFDNIRQFSPTGSAMIVVAQRDIDANNYSEMFLANDYSSSINAQWAEIYHRPDSTNIRLQTRDGSGYNNTDTGVARHINSMAYKLELKSASCELSLDGVVKAISTSALPTARLQPVFRTETDTTSSRSLNITYCEAYNT